MSAVEPRGAEQRSVWGSESITRASAKPGVIHSGYTHQSTVPPRASSSELRWKQRPRRPLAPMAPTPMVTATYPLQRRQVRSTTHAPYGNASSGQSERTRPPCDGLFDCLFHSGQPDSHWGAIGQMINRAVTQPVSSCLNAGSSLIDIGGCGGGLIFVGSDLKFGGNLLSKFLSRGKGSRRDRLCPNRERGRSRGPKRDTRGVPRFLMTV